MGNFLSALSKTSTTDALFNLPELPAPLKIRSSPRLPRKLFMLCSPTTQRKASATLLLPEPFGPTIAVIGASNSSEVFLAKLLNPVISILFNLTFIWYQLTRTLSRPLLSIREGWGELLVKRCEGSFGGFCFSFLLAHSCALAN